MCCEVFSKKTVKTRKPHLCDYCLSKIPAGSEVLCESGIFEREPFRRYACERCRPNVEGFWKSVGGECEDIPVYFYDYVHEGSKEEAE